MGTWFPLNNRFQILQEVFFFITFAYKKFSLLDPNSNWKASIQMVGFWLYFMGNSFQDIFHQSLLTTESKCFVAKLLKHPLGLGCCVSNFPPQQLSVRECRDQRVLVKEEKGKWWEISWFHKKEILNKREVLPFKMGNGCSTIVPPINNRGSSNN